MSCTIKATRVLIYYCASNKRCMIRIERWSSNTQKLPDGDYSLEARSDEVKGAQAHINDSYRAQAPKLRINDW